MSIVAYVRYIGVSIGVLVTLGAIPVQAQTIGLPQAPGVYVTFGGGGHAADAPGVAAFGDLHSQQSGDLGGAAADSLALAVGSATASATGVSTPNPGQAAAAAAAAAGDSGAASAAAAAAINGGTAGLVVVNAANDTSAAAAVANAGGSDQTSATSTGRGSQAAAAVSAASPNGSASASATPNGGRFIDADSGTWVSGSIGYALPLGGGIMGAIEAYGRTDRADDDLRILGAAGFRSVDNDAAFAAATAPVQNLVTTAEQEVRLSEFGVRLKAGNPGGAFPLVFGFEPFYISYEQETETTSKGSNAIFFTDIDARRRSDVDGRLYGAQAAVEVQVPLVGQSLFWLARGSGGFYRIDAEGDFFSDISTRGGTVDSGRVRDEEEDWGYRAGAETGVRVMFNPSLALSLTGAVDYLSDVPTAVLPRTGDDGVAHIGMDDRTTWRFGGQLTFLLGAP